MPIVPGSDGLVKDAEDAIKIAREVSHHSHILHGFASMEKITQLSLRQHLRHVVIGRAHIMHAENK